MSVKDCCFFIDLKLFLLKGSDVNIVWRCFFFKGKGFGSLLIVKKILFVYVRCRWGVDKKKVKRFYD